MIAAEVVWAALLEHDIDGLTVKDFAERAGCSVSKASKLLQGSAGVADGLTVRTEYRESYSKDFPGMRAGAHKVTVYMIPRDDLIKRLRERASK